MTHTDAPCIIRTTRDLPDLGILAGSEFGPYESETRAARAAHNLGLGDDIDAWNYVAI